MATSVDPRAQRHFIEICLQNRFLDQGQVDAALGLQQERAAQGLPMALGVILLELGHLKTEQLELALSVQRFMEIRREDTVFCQIAAKSDFLSKAQLGKVLKLQEDTYRNQGTYRRCADILLERGLLSLEQIESCQQAMTKMLRKEEAAEQVAAAAPAPKRREKASARVSAEPAPPPAPSPPAERMPSERMPSERPPSGRTAAPVPLHAQRDPAAEPPAAADRTKARHDTRYTIAKAKEFLAKKDTPAHDEDDDKGAAAGDAETGIKKSGDQIASDYERIVGAIQGMEGPRPRASPRHSSYQRQLADALQRPSTIFEAPRIPDSRCQLSVKPFEIGKSLGSEVDVQIVSVKGHVDAHTFPRLDSEIAHLMSQGHVCIVLDFAKLDYISSAGLGVLVEKARTLRQKDGDLRLCSVSDRIMRVLAVIGVDLIKVYPDERKAAQSF